MGHGKLLIKGIIEKMLKDLEFEHKASIEQIEKNSDNYALMGQIYFLKNVMWRGDIFIANNKIDFQTLKEKLDNLLKNAVNNFETDYFGIEFESENGFRYFLGGCDSALSDLEKKYHSLISILGEDFFD